MKTVHGLKTLLSTLSLFLIVSIGAKTLKVDTVTPSVTDGDFVITPNGTGDIVLGTFSGVLRATSGVLSVGSIDLTSEATGVLPVANGGTNSSTALNNNFVMISSGGSIVEDALISVTELSYLNGATSAIQTQLDGKIGTTGDESIAGVKTFTGELIAQSTTAPSVPAPIMSEVQRDALTGSAAGDQVFNSDTNQLNVYDGSAWVPVGSGGGGLDIFYSDGFEESVKSASFSCGNNASFLGGGVVDGTVSDETTSFISGSTSLEYIGGSSSTNDYCASPVITIAPGQANGQSRYIVFKYTYTGDDDDIKPILYDDTNNVVLSTSGLIKQSTNSSRYMDSYVIPTGVTELRYGFQVLVGNNTETFRMDDVELTTDPSSLLVNIGNVTGWEDYTPTNTQGFGSIATNNLQWRRVGDSMQIRGSFDTGTTDGNEAQLELPNSETIATGSTRSMAGIWLRDFSSNTHGGTVIATNGDTFLNFSTNGVFGSDTVNALVPVAGNSVVASAQGLTIDVTIPIEGWSANNDHVVTPAESSVESVEANGEAGYGSTATAIPYWTNITKNTLSTLGTWANDSTNGSSVTALTEVVALVSFSHTTSAAGQEFGISLDGSPTTAIDSLTADQRKAREVNSQATGAGNASAIVFMTSGQVLRPHGNGAGIGTAALGRFTVTLFKANASFLAATPIPTTGAFISNSGSASITRQSPSNPIASVSRTGVGTVDVTFKSGRYPFPPVAVATPVESLSNKPSCKLSASGSDAITVVCYNDGGTNQDQDFNLVLIDTTL